MEYKLRCAPNNGSKKYSVFKLHKSDSVTWAEAKMRRENEMQPWQIKAGSGRTARRFKAIKEGGVSDNASYFVFYKSKEEDNTYDVCPVDEMYSISATQRYKTLTAEEAEQKYEQRHKMLNLLAVMHSKKNGDQGEEGIGGGHDSKSFKVSEFDDWDQSGDDDFSGDDNDDSDETKKKNRKKKIGKKEKEDPDDAPDEAKEESDEGDFEQREVDYMSDVSSDSSINSEGDKDQNDVKGIAEEEALRDLLSTDEEDNNENPQQKGTKPGDHKLAPITSDIKQENNDNMSDDSSDSEDYDVDDEKVDSMFSKKDWPSQLSLVKHEVKQEPETSTSGASSSGAGPSGRPQSNSNKRKLAPETSAPTIAPSQPAKRPCVTESASGHEKIIEDLIIKYLSRKPMTLKNLLKDIKSKLKRLEDNTPGMDTDLVQTIAVILRRLNPEKQKISDVTYLSLKS